MPRTIGIVHRVKETKEGEDRPTRVAVLEGDNLNTFDLPTETDELSFLKGKFPTSYRDVTPEDNMADFEQHLCLWRELKEDEDHHTLPQGHVRTVKDKESGKPKIQVVSRVPRTYDGLKTNDNVAMTLGGSGDMFAAALSRRGETVNANIWRIPSAYLKDERDKTPKGNRDHDHELLARLLQGKLAANTADMTPFYHLSARDRNLIRIAIYLKLRAQALQTKIGCQIRIEQQAIGQIFTNEAGGYPEGEVATVCKQAQASDEVLLALEIELARRDADLAKAVKASPLWSEIFKDIKGVGPRIAAGIIAPIGDIRRFWVAPKKRAEDGDKAHSRARSHARSKGMARLKAYCGTFVLPDGTFPRRRADQRANWSPEARQALYLLIEQFNRRPNSPWGEKFRACKQKLREKHPTPITVGKKLVGLFREIERLFLKHSIVVDITQHDLRTIEGLYEFFRAGKSAYLEKVDAEEIPVNEGGRAAAESMLDHLERKIDAIPSGGKDKPSKQYTNGHIHNMARWTCAGKFVGWLFRKWTSVEKKELLKEKGGDPSTDDVAA